MAEPEARAFEGVPTSELMREFAAIGGALRNEASIPRELARRIRANLDRTLDETTAFFERDPELGRVLGLIVLEETLEAGEFSRELRDDERAELEGLERTFAASSDSRFANVGTAAYLFGAVVALNRMGWWGLVVALLGLFALIAAWALRLNRSYRRRVRRPIAAFLVRRGVSLLAILPLLGGGRSSLPVLESFRHDLDRDGPLLVVSALAATHPAEHS